MMEQPPETSQNDVEDTAATTSGKAPRRAGQPMYTEARGRHWELWIKVSSAAKRRRVRTWIPIRRHAQTGAVQNGDEAARALQTLAALWECPQPRWSLLQRTVEAASPAALRDLHDALVVGGLQGADSMFAAMLQEDEAHLDGVDLVPLVERWVTDPLPRKRGVGSISPNTHLMMVSRVLKMVSPELLAWRRQCSLAHRDKQPLPLRPPVTPFALRDYTWDRIESHLKASYRRAPAPKEAKALTSSNPDKRLLAENQLAGQGAGAAAAFTAFRNFARWLMEKGFLETDPTAVYKRPGEAKPKLIYLDSIKDIERVALRLTAPLDDIWRLMCATGIEPSVALELAVRDAQWHEYPALFTDGTKTDSRTRQAECGILAWGIVQRACENAKQEGRETLFPSHDARGRKLTRYLLAEEVRAATLALVAQGHTRFKGVHPYTSRHTFSVMALQKGASHQEVAHQLGHVDTAMVIKRYGKYLPACGRIAAAIDGHGDEKSAPGATAPNTNGGVADAHRGE